jgi:hypothetical protein
LPLRTKRVMTSRHQIRRVKNRLLVKRIGHLSPVYFDRPPYIGLSSR